MTPDTRPLDVRELWRRTPGAVDPWVQIVVALACTATVVVAAVGSHVMWQQGGRASGLDRWWFCNGLAVMLAIWIAISFVPPSRVSRFARAAVLLPIGQLAAMLVLWRAYGTLSPRMPYLTAQAPMLEMLPIGWVVLGAIGWTAAAAAAISRGKRPDEVLHAAVMLALVMLLLFGLWLPIASRVWCGSFDAWSAWTQAETAFEAPRTIAAIMIAPPALAAVVTTRVALRRPEWALRARPRIVVALVVMLAAGTLLRIGVADYAATAYLNFAHVLLALAGVAAAAMIVLGAVTWWRGASARRRLASEAHPRVGIVAHEVPGERTRIAWVEVTSWLRGPRTLVRDFVVRTAGGEIRVPGGIPLVSPLPLETSQLRAGEAVVVLQAGDPVVLGGYVDRDGDHPFRAASSPVPGDRGIFVARIGAERGFGDVVMTLWRPSSAYLLILVAIALPALAASRTFSP